MVGGVSAGDGSGSQPLRSRGELLHPFTLGVLLRGEVRRKWPGRSPVERSRSRWRRGRPAPTGAKAKGYLAGVGVGEAVFVRNPRPTAPCRRWRCVVRQATCDKIADAFPPQNPNHGHHRRCAFAIFSWCKLGGHRSNACPFWGGRVRCTGLPPTVAAHRFPLFGVVWVLRHARVFVMVWRSVAYGLAVCGPIVWLYEGACMRVVSRRCHGGALSFLPFRVGLNFHRVPFSCSRRFPRPLVRVGVV